jgi:hypothetical protein
MGSESTERSGSREAMADVLRNHRGPLLRWTSLPSQRSRLVFCIAFFVIGHDRRKILHFNVTRNPNASGLCSNCEKRGPTNSHTDSCYSTETQSLEPMWFRR